MPISIDKFEKATKSKNDRILEFLGKNRDTGFTLWEIIKECEEYSPSNDFIGLFQNFSFAGEYIRAINELIKENKIKAGEIGGEKYYGIA